MYRCVICKGSFKDEVQLHIHYEIKHSTDNNEIEQDEQELDEIDQMLANHQSLTQDEEIEDQLTSHQQNSRPSVIQYAPGPSVSVNLHARALPGNVVTHFKIDNAKLQLEEFVNNAKGLVINTLQNELKRLNFIKFGLLLDALFTNVQNETSPRGFLTKNRTVMFASNIDLIVDECFEELLTKLQEHEGRGSGWSLLNIIGLDVRVHKHGYGMRGSSYIPLPKKLVIRNHVLTCKMKMLNVLNMRC